MANSRFAYVRSFELPDPLLPSTYMVCRIDGRSFHRFTDAHVFEKPNDERGLRLMDKAAEGVMHELRDVVLAFGESDEFSFLLRKDSTLYSRRQSKILSAILSIFTSSYVFHWPTFFPSTPLQYPPSFDARIVLYPSEKEVRDYFAWRQADTHINNLYNTVFWALVLKGGLDTAGAHAELRGTVSAQKHEILHSRFGVNYNNLPERYRKGSILVRKPPEPAPVVHSMTAPRPPLHPSASAPAEVVSPLPDAAWSSPSAASTSYPSPLPSAEPFALPVVFSSPNTTAPSASEFAEVEPRKEGKEKKARRQPPPWDGTSGDVEVLHVDIIRDEFWEERPWLLR
ncbi:tRNAHis guanylyltransferase [Calocera viscosa TUFC12733]|uniref:tRNA(His) guanylyltransferase n=1 Tax=Calocera viscosa (strain TUFC12733) TaxID=1330018 RepID=A0A167PSJ9_CALVF|nr:tRNAHis guanylyltransferase [Calocera viscosa TUFC12733]